MQKKLVNFLCSDLIIPPNRTSSPLWNQARMEGHGIDRAFTTEKPETTIAGQKIKSLTFGTAFSYQWRSAGHSIYFFPLSNFPSLAVPLIVLLYSLSLLLLYVPYVLYQVYIDVGISKDSLK
jgi:hypothetical protein